MIADNSKGISKKIPKEKIIAFLNRTWERIKENPKYQTDDNYLDGENRVFAFITDEDGKWIIYYQQHNPYRIFDAISYLKHTTFYEEIKKVLIINNHGVRFSVPTST